MSKPLNHRVNKDKKSGSWGSQSAVYCSCVVSSSDQSGILHEVYKSGPQFEENAVQKTEWGVWSQNQRGDKVSVILSLRPKLDCYLKAQSCVHVHSGTSVTLTSSEQ